MRNRDECRLKDLHYSASLIRIAVVSAFNNEVKMPAYEDVMQNNTAAESSNVVHGWEDSKAFMNAVMKEANNK